MARYSPSRLGRAALLFVAACFSPLPAATAHAQYLFLDSNGDSTSTEADTLRSAGATTVEVWLRTDRNRAGTQAVCASGAEPLTTTSFEIALRAEGGTVRWSGFVNLQAPRIACGLERADSTEFLASLCGVPPAAPGALHLARLSVEVLAGAPLIRVVPFSRRDPAFGTSFGSECDGIDLDNTQRLGKEWFDVDGLRYRGSAGAPWLDHPDLMTLAEADTLIQGVVATDADGSLVSMTKLTGPGFMSVTTPAAVPGIAIGRITLSPGYSDAGRYLGEIMASDIADIDIKAFGIIVSNANQPPNLSPIKSICAERGQTTTRYLRAIDGDGDLVSITVRDLPPFMTFEDHGRGYATLNISPAAGEATDSLALVVTVSDGVAADSQLVSIRVEDLGGCSGLPALAGRVTPNPMRDGGELVFWTGTAGPVRVTLHDVGGRLVRVLLEDPGAPAGYHRVFISPGRSKEPGALRSAVYFIRIESPQGVGSARVVLLR